jgi:predicted ribosomally synthesized peptide with SipW-like signal peptide
MRLRYRRRKHSTPASGRRRRIPHRYKIALLLGLAGLAGTIGGTYAAFTAHTSSGDNSISTGSVTMTDDDGGSLLFSLSGMKPSDAAVSKCIEVTYTGSLPANAGLFGQHFSGSAALLGYLNLSVTRGTLSPPSFPSCTNFTPDSTNYIGAGNGIVFNGTIGGYPTSAGTAIHDPPSGTIETWTNGEKRAYKLTVSVQNTSAAQGLSAIYAFVWGAQSE